MKKDLISIKDLSRQEIEEIFSLAKDLKKNKEKYAQRLKGKTLALIFQKPSNRTRVSFAVGIFELGGQGIYLSPQEISLGKRQLVRAIAYVIKADVRDDSNFFEALTKKGYEIRAKELQIFYGGAKKGDWDVGIVMDIIKLMPKLDVVVLASGDGDYIPLLEYLQIQGVRVELVSFGKSTSSKMRELVDYYLDLDSDPRKYLMPIRNRSGKK